MTQRAPGRFAGLARPLLHFAGTLEQARRPDEKALLAEAEALLAGFAERAERDGALASTVPPARYALAVVIDRAARRNRRINLKTWATGAHRMLFDGRGMDIARIRGFRDTAETAGPEYRDLAQFLSMLLERMEAESAPVLRAARSRWPVFAALAVVVFLAALAGYAVFLDYRYHAKLLTSFDADAGIDGVTPALEPAALSAALDRVADSADRTMRAAEKSPLPGVSGVLRYGAGARAAAAYGAVADQTVPAAMARAVDEAIAQEGDGLRLYGTLRTWAILTGQSDWSPGFLAGWLEARADSLPSFAGLARHVAALSGPQSNLQQPDPLLMTQALDFATEASEPERAFLELARSDAVRALPRWRGDRVAPDLDQVFQRRSGLGLTAPIAGLYTTEGWDHARTTGAGLAVQKARAEAVRLFPNRPAEVNNAPDLVLEQLHRQTVAEWKALLADLRVHPFTDNDTAVLISGRLSQRDSPLPALLTEVWRQVGGTDRRRSHPQQISLATSFGPMIQYVEQGRMRDIAKLFGALNVALGAMDQRNESRMQQLMNVQERGQSVAALRQAPAVVVQIVEDVLAQSAAVHADSISNPLTRLWQRGIFPDCRAVTAGQFPFAANGPDGDIDDFAAVFGPDGRLPRFFRSQLVTLIDREGEEWRWRPEARFSGLSPESAVFFQRAMAISEAYFGGSDTLSRRMRVATLAERGQAFMNIGGTEVALSATAEPADLSWPGAAPHLGISVTLSAGANSATLTEPGAWGMIRLFDQVRLRARDGGRRFLVDLRASGGRVFVEVVFDDPANPLSRRALLLGFACPAAL